MENVTALQKTKKKFWCIVSDTNGYPTVYEIGDYIAGRDPFLYLFKDSEDDERPIAIFNMSYVASVEFFDEKPQVVNISEEQIEELMNGGGEMAVSDISSDQSMELSEE